jgi:hypothetical protein
VFVAKNILILKIKRRKRMATLTIKIKGIALINIENEWKIYMPFDGCHKVTLKAPKHGIVRDLADAEQQISISVINSAESNFPVPIPMPDPISFPSFFDITHPIVHGNGVSLRKTWADRTVLMTIPGGVYSASTSDESYSLYKGNIKIRNLGPLGVEGTLKIQAEEIRLDIIGGGADFPLRFLEDSVVVIDNDCHATENNDLPMLYEQVLSEKTAPRFQVLPDSGGTDLPCNNFRVSKPLGVDA